MSRLADQLEDCIDRQGIKTYEELIEIFGTPHDVVEDEMRNIDEKALRALARRKHSTWNVVIYLALLSMLVFVAYCILTYSLEDVYCRGKYIDTCFVEHVSTPVTEHESLP